MSYICEKCGVVLHEFEGQGIKVICASCFIKIMRKADEALEKMKGVKEDGKQSSDKRRKSK